MDILKKRLLGALIGLSRASESKEILESSGIALIQGLALAYGTTPPEDYESSVEQMIKKLHKEKTLMAPDCAVCQYPCGRTADYDMDEILEASESLRNVKLYLLSLLGTIALDSEKDGNSEIRQFLSDTLFQISCTYEAGQLSGLIQEAERMSETP